VFDGNSPFQGLLDALSERPHVWSIWSRRGMWRPNTDPHFIERETCFDAVIEPRDLAGAFDEGPTTRSSNLTRYVDPIRLLDRHELLPKDMARSELGLDQDTTTILIQLGGGNNFDMRLTRDLVLRHLGERPDVQIVILDWKISTTHLPDIMPKNASSVSTFPIARYLNAFDATVSAVGYNSFHEAVDAGLPAILVPNENPSQDDQLARASFAARHGAAILARRDQPESLLQALEAILDPVKRSEMARANQRLSCPNGVTDAVKIIADLAQTNRGLRTGLTTK
jgi:UDP:flavonoid glycosyltransferase YjiC (YdhE family)